MRGGKEMECKRCGDNEDRIDGFCSNECKDKYSLEEALSKMSICIAELEAMVEQLIWVGNDLLIDNANPVTVVLFNGLVAKAKEKERER